MMREKFFLASTISDIWRRRRRTERIDERTWPPRVQNLLSYCRTDAGLERTSLQVINLSNLCITVTSHVCHGISNNRQLELVQAYNKENWKPPPPLYWLLVEKIHRRPVDTPHKGSVIRKAFSTAVSWTATHKPPSSQHDGCWCPGALLAPGHLQPSCWPWPVNIRSIHMRILPMMTTYCIICNIISWMLLITSPTK